MAYLEELSRLAKEAPENPLPEKSSLLAKFEIPIQHLEFDYIEKCTDGSELEKIYQILKSGEEGYFPDLTKSVEERLILIKPKSKFLRKSCPVVDKYDLTKDERNEISQDLDKWVSKISKNNKELENRKLNSNNNSEVSVREYKEINGNSNKDNSEKRIKSTDYTAWDKYDPDTEILKMDIEEEKIKNTALKTKSIKPKKTVKFNKFATEAEAEYISNREKEKGNEFFRAGDYKEALQCYNNSIESKATADNLNNRAVTYIKLKNYDKALNDAESVLTIDGDNVKAYLRKSQALEGLKRHEEALESIDHVIQQDPNNEIAQELANRVRRQCNVGLKNTRMKIVEIE